LLKAASGGSDKESRTKSRTNAIWPELIGLEFISVASVLFDRERKPGRTRSSLTVERQSNPTRLVENIQATRRDASGQKTAAAKSSSRPGVQAKVAAQKGRPLCLEVVDLLTS